MNKSFNFLSLIQFVVFGVGGGIGGGVGDGFYYKIIKFTQNYYKFSLYAFSLVYKIFKKKV